MLEKGAWWVERGWVLRYTLLGRLWPMPSRPEKGLGPSAQRQIFVVLEGFCWNASRTHLDKNPGKDNRKYSVGSAALGELLQAEPRRKSNNQMEAGLAVVPYCRVGTGRVIPAAGQKPLEVSKKKGDGLQPQPCLDSQAKDSRVCPGWKFPACAMALTQRWLCWVSLQGCQGWWIHKNLAVDLQVSYIPSLWDVVKWFLSQLPCLSYLMKLWLYSTSVFFSFLCCLECD